MSNQPSFVSRVARVLGDTPAAPVTEQPLVAAPAIQKAVSDALDRGETHYTDRPGILRLREQVAAALSARFGILADGKNNLIVTCGVIEARFVALQQVLTAGDAVDAPEHADRIAGAVLLRRATLVRGGAGSRVIYLTSGASQETLRQRLADLAPETTVLFEIEEESSSFHPAMIEGLAERTLTIGQIGHASWQTGFLLSPTVSSAGLRDFKQALTICSTNLSQWAGLAAMETV